MSNLNLYGATLETQNGYKFSDVKNFSADCNSPMPFGTFTKIRDFLFGSQDNCKTNRSRTVLVCLKRKSY